MKLNSTTAHVELIIGERIDRQREDVRRKDAVVIGKEQYAACRQGQGPITCTTLPGLRLICGIHGKPCSSDKVANDTGS